MMVDFLYWYIIIGMIVVWLFIEAGNYVASKDNKTLTQLVREDAKKQNLSLVTENGVRWDIILSILVLFWIIIPAAMFVVMVSKDKS